MVYVLIFVSSEKELSLVQNHVQDWKSREILTSNLYVRYITIMTPSEFRTSAEGWQDLRYVL